MSLDGNSRFKVRPAREARRMVCAEAMSAVRT